MRVLPHRPQSPLWIALPVLLALWAATAVSCDDPIPVVLSHDSSLSALGISAPYPLVPDFSPTVTEYSVTVPYGVSALSLEPAATSSQARLLGPRNSPLAEGTNTLTVTVTAQDGTTTEYRVTVNRKARSTTDSSLMALGLSTGTLNPAFSPATTDYTLTLPNTTGSLTVTPTTANPGAAARVTQGSPPVTVGGDLSLTVGTTVLTVTVVSEDGASQTAYRVSVTRQRSSVSTLAALTVSAGTLSPAFSPGTTAYSVSLPYTQTSLTVTATKTSPVSAFTQAGGPALVPGNNLFTVTVTAEDGTQTIYVLHATRNPTSSSLSSLLALSLGSGITLSPPFSPGTLAYSAVVPYATSSVTVSATRFDTQSTVAGTGTKTLTVGSTNTLPVTVTAQDGVTKTVYAVQVQRLASGFPALSNDSSLSDLTVKDQKTALVLPLSPPFSPAVTTYSVTAPYSGGNPTDIVVTPTAVSGKATAATVFTTIGPPRTTAPILVPQTLNPGYNPVTVTVTAEDGSSTDYQLTVVTASTVLSNVSTLSALAVKTGSTVRSLGQTFSPWRTEYTVSLPVGTTSVTVTPTKTDAGATVGTITGATGLVAGSNLIRIPVTAADKTTTTYTVTAWVPLPLSSDSSLASLSVAGASLSPSFSSGVHAYSLTVPAKTSALTLSSVPSDSAATVSVVGNSGLTAGVHTVTVTVRAADGVSTHKTDYVLTVTVPQSSDTTLSALSLTSGGIVRPLTPAFSPSTTSYAVTLPEGTTSATVAATKADPTALSVTGTGVQTLTVGTKVLTVTVTAQDGTQGTYTLTVTVPPVSASVSTLSALSLSSGTLSPAFAAGTTAYTASVPNSVASVTVTATPTVAGASVQTTGNGSLAPGPNTVTVKVTSLDGTATTTYTMTITRAAASGFPASAKLTGTATYANPSDHAAFWIWVTNSSGVYLGTMLLYGHTTPGTPPSGGLDSQWTTAKGTTSASANNGVDAITSPTWLASNKTRTFKWTFTNTSGVAFGPGTYTFHIAVHQQNGPSKTYTATITLGTTAVTQNFAPLDSVLSAGSVSFTP